MPKAFFDTNILVYQLDARYPKKQETCRRLLADSASSNEAVISTQVLQEFYVATTVKLGIDPSLIKSIMRVFENMEVVTVGKDLIHEAADVSVQRRISFWDALIVVSAESAKCGLLYSEDLNAGQVMRGVRVVNPMK